MNNEIKEEDKIILFDIKSMDQELEYKFYQFFKIYNLDPLFTDAHKTKQIPVSDNDLRAVVNPGGAYHNTLKYFADYLLVATDNQMVEEAIFRIIESKNSFRGMMNNLKKVKEEIETSINSKHMFNMWNIVWYNKDLQ